MKEIQEWQQNNIPPNFTETYSIESEHGEDVVSTGGCLSYPRSEFESPPASRNPYPFLSVNPLHHLCYGSLRWFNISSASRSSDQKLPTSRCIRVDSGPWSSDDKIFQTLLDIC